MMVIPIQILTLYRLNQSEIKSDKELLVRGLFDLFFVLLLREASPYASRTSFGRFD